MVQSAQGEAQGYTSKSAYSPFHELLSHLGKQHDREVQLLSHALDMARQEVDKLRAALIAQLGPNCADVQGLSAAVLGSNSLLALLSAPGCSMIPEIPDERAGRGNQAAALVQTDSPRSDSSKQARQQQQQQIGEAAGSPLLDGMNAPNTGRSRSWFKGRSRRRPAQADPQAQSATSQMSSTEASVVDSEAPESAQSMPAQPMPMGDALDSVTAETDSEVKQPKDSSVTPRRNKPSWLSSITGIRGRNGGVSGQASEASTGADASTSTGETATSAESNGNADSAPNTAGSQSSGPETAWYASLKKGAPSPPNAAPVEQAKSSSTPPQFAEFQLEFQSEGQTEEDIALKGGEAQQPARSSKEGRSGRLGVARRGMNLLGTSQSAERAKSEEEMSGSSASGGELGSNNESIAANVQKLSPPLKSPSDASSTSSVPATTKQLGTVKSPRRHRQTTLSNVEAAPSDPEHIAQERQHGHTVSSIIGLPEHNQASGEANQQGGSVTPSTTASGMSPSIASGSSGEQVGHSHGAEGARSQQPGKQPHGGTPRDKLSEGVLRRTGMGMLSMTSPRAGTLPALQHTKACD